MRDRPAPPRNPSAVIRSFVIAGTFVVLLVPPAVAFGAPPGPVYVPARAAAAASSRSGAGARGGTQEHFRVPFEVNVRPQPPAETQQHEWIGWRTKPSYLWYQPAWYQPTCAFNGFSAPSSAAPGNEAPAEFTIGSLVDKQSESLFSPANHSYTAGLASSSTASATSSPFALQFSSQSTPCGPSNFVNL